MTPEQTNKIIRIAVQMVTDVPEKAGGRVPARRGRISWKLIYEMRDALEAVGIDLKAVREANNELKRQHMEKLKAEKETNPYVPPPPRPSKPKRGYGWDR